MQLFRDKINIKEILSANKKIVLNLGGGQDKIVGVINVDLLDLPAVDIVTDLNEGLTFIPDNSIDEIICHSFLEHVSNFEFLMSEILRVLEKGGKVNIFVPHFSNPYYYSDYTHKRFFGYYTFYYFANDQSKIMRKVPGFYSSVKFRVVSQKIIFASTIPKYHLINIFCEWFFNVNIRLQEIYEAYFTHLFPCNGLEVRLQKPT